MKLTLALVLACLSTAVAYADTYTYSCKVCMFPGGDGCEEVGNAYPLRVDDSNNLLEWRGKKYKVSGPDACGRSGWEVEGNGTSFKFCTTTLGYGTIEDKDGVVRVRCNLKK